MKNWREERKITFKQIRTILGIIKKLNSKELDAVLNEINLFRKNTNMSVFELFLLDLYCVMFSEVANSVLFG